MDNPSLIKGGHSLLLVCAAATHNTDQAAVLNSILRNGASIHDWDANGNTCLHIILSATRPDQPWTVQSLVELLHAGADPSQSNHAGLSAFDVACNDSKELGSFRRDVLLQALIESGNDIQDERLLMTTLLTASYTPLHHALICGDALASTTFHLRQTLINRLANTVESRDTPAYSKLYDIAVDRVLSAYSARGSIDPNIAFNHAHNYHHRMIGLKKQLCLMSNERLSCETRTTIENIIDTRQAGIATLQGLDWLRPVDLDDLFARYINTLIQQLEDCDTAVTQASNLRKVIETLKRSISRSQRIRPRQLERHTATGGSMRDSAIEIPRNKMDEEFLRDQGPPRPPHPQRQSIVETPVAFYPGHRDESASRLPQLNVANNEQNQDSTTDGIEGQSQRKASVARTPIQFYRRRRPNDENQPFTSTGRP